MRRDILRSVLLLLLAGCGLASGDEVAGWPDVDLGVDAVVYKSAPERDLHLHVFEPETSSTSLRGAALFFHGGGFRETRVPQFERQARLLADAGVVGIVVEYRVGAEGAGRADAIEDGRDAVQFVKEAAARFGVDPDRVAVAGSSAGGALAAEASAEADAVVLFNPAVGRSDAPFVEELSTIVFHSRADTIVPFASAESFCSAAVACELVAFEEGDHGFFNDEPAFSATFEEMQRFLRDLGW